MTRLFTLKLLGVAVSAACLAVIATRFSWSGFATAVADVRGTWLVLAALAVVGSVTTRATRLGLLLGRGLSPWRACFRATVAGYVGNWLLPARAGEVMRVAMLSKLADIPAARCLILCLVDRLLDLAMLIVMGAVVLSAFDSGIISAWAVLALLGGGTLIVGQLMVFARFGHRWHDALVRFGQRGAPWRAAIPRFHAQLLEGVRLMASPGFFLPAAAVSLGAAALDVLAAYAVLSAFGWGLPLFAALVVQVCIYLGGMLPSAPAALGVYQAACVVSLALFGVAESPALAFSLLMQGTLLSMILLLATPELFFRFRGWARRA